MANLAFGTGASGAAGALLPTSNVLHVNPAGAAGGNGSETRPFRTLQAAVNALPEGASTILAEPGAYDEDLTVDLTRRQITIGSLGLLQLGLFGVVGTPSGVRRNLTLIGDVSSFAILSSFVWTNFAQSTSPVNANNVLFAAGAMPSISGQVRVSPSVSGFVYVEIHGFVNGDTGSAFGASGTAYTDVGAAAGSSINLVLQNAVLWGALLGGKTLLNGCYSAAAYADLTLLGYGSVLDSNVLGSVTWTLNPVGLGDVAQAPNGFGRCRFGAGKTFTGPAGATGSLVLDSDSNKSFLINSCVLAGGATKVVTSDPGSISGNAVTVTTNANLTGPVTSVGNATALVVVTASGTYTPTLTNVANVASSTARKCQWMRVGNTVTVSGSLDETPTLAALATIGITLPVASALALATDCAGTAVALGVAMPGSISGDVANDRAQLDFVAAVGANTMYFSFTYEVK